MINILGQSINNRYLLSFFLKTKLFKLSHDDIIIIKYFYDDCAKLDQLVKRFELCSSFSVQLSWYKITTCQKKRDTKKHSIMKYPGYY